jgi:hypothetical protein
MSEPADYPIAVALINDVDIAGHQINTTLLSAVLAFLIGWVVLYMVYKMFWRADFGLPVRRRLLRISMSVQADQEAFVPLFWSDLQIQRAVTAHWKKSLRSTIATAAGSGRTLEDLAEV